MMCDFENNILKNVSRETVENLKVYQQMLGEWQEKFNLVSRNSLPDAWIRHFLDSAQLAEYINPAAETVYDFGSGAGFPALVLSIMFKEINPKTRFVLIDSVAKKTLFLNEVAARFKVNAEVLNTRIEKLDLPAADYITARAVTCLDNLFEYSLLYLKKDTVCLFLKGKSYESELSDAQKAWNFVYKVHPNKVSDGVILEIKNLRRKK